MSIKEIKDMREELERMGSSQEFIDNVSEMIERRMHNTGETFKESLEFIQDWLTGAYAERVKAERNKVED